MIMSNEEIECQHEDVEPMLCAACSGSGEGMYDGSRCGTCGGCGETEEQYCLDCGEHIDQEEFYDGY